MSVVIPAAFYDLLIAFPKTKEGLFGFNSRGGGEKNGSRITLSTFSSVEIGQLSVGLLSNGFAERQGVLGAV